jgi:cation diffusion facilitator CzcD-associated flavoprotein CzcO
VTSIRQDGAGWLAETSHGGFSAAVMVVATGIADAPYRLSWPGMDTFRGPIVHSSDYRNPDAFGGKRVLVVGFGNSGGEIALDLAEAKVDTAIAVRSPVQIIPRDLLGLPILTWVILYRPLPARLVDFINAPVLWLAVGNFEKLGLRRAAKGPRQMVEEDGHIPLVDVGTLAKIRDGSLTVRGGIEQLTADGVIFTDGTQQPFDAIVLATGFRPDLRRLLPGVEFFDPQGMPRVTGKPSAPGLYFCG